VPAEAMSSLDENEAKLHTPRAHDGASNRPVRNELAPGR